MCHWVERARARRRGEDGFSLIEVMVAVGLLVVVLVALLPELVVGIRATSGAKSLTQAKGVLQGQLEKMRSMPYHVAPLAGDYIDLLDTYYTNLAPPTPNVTPPTPGCRPAGVWVAPRKDWSGFVDADDMKRCPYEPALGAFYRYVIEDISHPGLGSFTLVVDTAFLSSALTVAPATVPPAMVPTVVRPPTGYTSQTAGFDTPTSGQVGVWATIVYRPSSALKPVTTYTQVAERNLVDSTLEVAATVNTVRVVSQTDDRPAGALEPGPFSTITLDAGVVAQSGARFTGSTVSMNANAVSASSGTGALAEGARATLSAPGSAPPVFPVPGWGGLNGSCLFACFGSSSVGGAWVSAADGLPLSAHPTAPVRVALTSALFKSGHSSAKARHGGAGQYGGFAFNNGPDKDAAGSARGLRYDHPMVTLDGWEPGVSYAQSDCANTTTSESGNFLSASGFLDADPVTAPAVTSCVTARSAPVMLFPTEWAPDGVIRVTLDQSSLKCQVVRTTGVGSVTARFRATVEYWNGAEYRPAGTITEANGDDPLAQWDLSTMSVGNGFMLSQFIQSWRSSTSIDVARNKVTTATSARAKVPGVVSITSTPTREGDLTSVVSVTVGTFTCSAKDIR